MAEAQGIVFRRASSSDIPAIRTLASRIWHAHYPGIISPEQIEYMLDTLYSSDVIGDEIEKQGWEYVLVLFGHEASGFIAYLHEPVQERIKIGKLYLLPSLHTRGIGRRMLGYVKDAAARAGAKTIYLFVNKMNVKAIRAYERFGMVKAAEIVTDIGGGFVMDDYRMELIF